MLGSEQIVKYWLIIVSRSILQLVFQSNKGNLQLVQEGQGNLSLLSVQADQQYHVVQQYPEVQADQGYPKVVTERYGGTN